MRIGNLLTNTNFDKRFDRLKTISICKNMDFLDDIQILSNEILYFFTNVLQKHNKLFCKGYKIAKWIDKILVKEKVLRIKLVYTENND